MQLLFLQEWFSERATRIIGWTLVHSLWQGILAAAIAGIIIISTRKATARLRYNLLLGVFAMFLLSAGITFYFQVNSIDGLQPLTQSVLVQGAADMSVADNEEAYVPVKTQIIRDFSNWFNIHAGTFLLVWAVFFIIHCIKLFTGLAGVQRIRTHRTIEVGEAWQLQLNKLARSISVSKPVVLLQSGLVKVPLAIGYFKPVILLPLGLVTNLPADQVATILLHELAHIRRRDYLVNLLQRFAETVFFFNPGLCWISSLIRQEREACCDDIVVAHTPYKGTYLEALVSFQEYALAPSGYAMAIGHKKDHLLSRVKRMLTRENKKLNAMEKLVLLTGILALSAFGFIPKKETHAAEKPVVAIAQAVAEPAVLTPEVPSAKKRVKPVIKKESRKKELQPVVKTDTVPAAKSNKEEDLQFPSISRNVNKEGNTRTEQITATDQNGKKYIISRLNDKITGLTLDGKAIPENEFGNYESLVKKIDYTVEQNKIRRDIERKSRIESRKNAELFRERTAIDRKEKERISREQRLIKDRIRTNNEIKKLEIRQRLIEREIERKKNLQKKLNSRVVSSGKAGQGAKDEIDVEDEMEHKIEKEASINEEKQERLKEGNWEKSEKISVLKKESAVNIVKKFDYNHSYQLNVSPEIKMKPEVYQPRKINVESKLSVKPTPLKTNIGFEFKPAKPPVKSSGTPPPPKKTAPARKSVTGNTGLSGNS